MKKYTKKAFTLTELLVVVVVVGVLAAVAVPQFNRVLETRRTTEAESLMTAVRTEQEKRCTFNKPYAGTFDRIGDIVSRTPSTSSKTTAGSYNYALEEQGITASSRGKDYSLKMLSYKDGVLCCEGDYCDSLNKNYPKCASLSATVEAACSAPACELDPAGCACNPNQCKCPAYAASHCECTGTCYIECSGPASQTCNTCGTQSRTCDTSTGTWNSWGACSVGSAGECAKECTGAQPAASEACNDCGTRTRSVTCNSTTGEWAPGAWSACSKTQAECDALDCDKSAAVCLKAGQIFDAAACRCNACPPGQVTVDGVTCKAPACEKTAAVCLAEGKIFDKDKCECTLCPDGQITEDGNSCKEPECAEPTPWVPVNGGEDTCPGNDLQGEYSCQAGFVGTCTDIKVEPNDQFIRNTTEFAYEPPDGFVWGSCYNTERLANKKVASGLKSEAILAQHNYAIASCGQSGPPGSEPTWGFHLLGETGGVAGWIEYGRVSQQCPSSGDHWDGGYDMCRQLCGITNPSETRGCKSRVQCYTKPQFNNTCDSLTSGHPTVGNGFSVYTCQPESGGRKWTFALYQCGYKYQKRTVTCCAK